MKYFVLVGEASGDMHAATYIRELRKRDPQAVFVGTGGEQMAEAGVRLLLHYRKMAFMGVIAVLRNAKQIRANFRLVEQALLDERPDVLILVDYPSFNLKMAEFARTHLPGVKIVYYIPPKVWAWKTHRIHRIARLCDEVQAIFPFEPAFYAKYGYSCTYVGNPTVKAITAWKKSNSAAVQLPAAQRSNIIAILPGSRKNEIRNCLPKMLKAAKETGLPISIAQAPGMEEAFYQPYMTDGIRLEQDTWNLLSRAKVALVTSGTATLEAALLGCPQVAVYRIITSRWLGWLRPFIFKIPYFTLVNIIAGKQVIYEAIGPHFSKANIRRELKRLLGDETYRQNMLNEYKTIYEKLEVPSGSGI